MGFSYFFPIYIKLPWRSSNSDHSQEARVPWPWQVFCSSTRPPFHVAFVFCWLCLFLWLTAHCHTIPHTLCSLSLTNQPISMSYSCCIHFYLSPTLICIWPSLAGYHTCSAAPGVDSNALEKPTPCARLLQLFIPPSSGSIVLFSLQNLYFKSNLCSLSLFLIHRQFFRAEELEQSFL